MKRCALVVWVIACWAMATNVVYADYTWFTYNGHSYTLTNPGSWTQAQSEAVSLGGNLVTINDAAENAWLVSTLASNGMFIGLYQSPSAAEPAAGWGWISGEASSYRNWDTAFGEPDEAAGGSEDYAMINVTGFTLGKWHDAYDAGWPVQYSYRGIVEVVPEPASIIALLGGLISLLGIRRGGRRRA